MEKQITNAKRWIKKCLAKCPEMKCGMIFHEAVLQSGDKISLTWEDFKKLYSDLRYNQIK